MDDSISLGKLSLEAEVDLRKFSRNVEQGRREAGTFEDALDALSTVADVAGHALGNVRMTPRQGAETRGTAETIISGVRGIGEESAAAAREIDRVRITDRQAAESDAAGEAIKHNVKDIGDEADRTKRKLAEMKVAGAGGAGGGGFGRVGLLGTAIGAGVLTTPAAGPAALGILAVLPGLLATVAGAGGVAFLALQGVGKAIGGDKKAFDDLAPSAQQFVLTIRSLDGWVDKLKQTAAGNLFPGLEQGLHSALSPGTLATISVAVAALAHALGMAGAEWGHYFGSPEFQHILGPLMLSAAHNIGVLSDTFLHLFDAIGLVARDAIPLTEWMLHATDSGARLADEWLHAKDASGAMSHAMGEAQQSLRLVAGLVEALLHAVGALGVALYPVSKIAVKDLTDGLNELAGIIDRNKATIRDIVEGALTALVTTVKTLTPFVDEFVHGLDEVSHSIGGWDQSFELIIGGLLVTKFAALTKGVFGLGTAAATAEGEAAGLSTTLGGLAALGLITIPIDIVIERKIKDKLGKAGSAYDYTVGFFTQGNVGTSPITALGNLLFGSGGGGSGGGGSGLNASSKASRLDALEGSHSADPSQMAAGRSKMLAFARAALGKPYMWGHAGPNSFDCSGLVMWAFSNGLNVTLPHSTYDQAMMGAQVNPNKASVGDVVFTNYGEKGLAGPGHEGLIVGFKNGQPIIEAAPHTGAKVQTYAGYGAFTGGAKFTVRDVTASSSADYSPFGSDPPFTTNTGQLTAKQKAAAARKALAARLQIPVIHDQTLVAHFKALAAAATTGPMIARYLDGEVAALKRENVDLASSMQGKSAVQKARIHGQIQKNEDQITKLHDSVLQAIKMAADAKEFSKFTATMKLLESKFQADSAYASVLTGAVAEKYQNVLLGDLVSQRTTLEAEQKKKEGQIASASGKRKTQLEGELAKIDSSLSSVNDQILQSLEGAVQTMQSHESSIFSSVTSEFQQQFEAKTQELIDQAGVQFFQNGALTPEELAIQAMTEADRQKSLQDALANAKTPAEKAAAQRAIEEDHAQTAATESRRKADEAYAAAVKQIQAQRSKVEAQMNADLQKLSDGLLNGTASMSDLTAIADKYGITISQDTIPDFNNLGAATNDLQKAFEDLVAYIGKTTGQSPSGSSSSGSNGLNRKSLLDFGLAAGGGGRLPNPDMPPIGISPASLAAVVSGPYALRSTPTGMGDIVLMLDNEVLGRMSTKAITRSPANVRVVAAAVQPALDRVTSIRKGG